MPANFYPSANIKVFPSTYRTKYVSGKFTTETNFTNILKALSDKFYDTDKGNDGFVVYHSEASPSIPGDLRVVIDGYFFEISNFSTSSTDLYLYINDSDGYLKNVEDSTVNLDNTANNFTGIAYSTSIVSDYKCLQVVKGSKFCNQGYIKNLTDADGNWYEIANLFNILTSDGKIDASKIDFTKISGILNILVTGATKLVKPTSPYAGYNAGGVNQPVYFTKDGVPANITTNIGTSTADLVKVTTGTFAKSGLTVGSKGVVRNEMYLNNGTFTNGNKITISGTAPGSSDAGENGDLWFVIGS